MTKPTTKSIYRSAPTELALKKVMYSVYSSYDLVLNEITKPSLTHTPNTPNPLRVQMPLPPSPLLGLEICALFY